MANLLEKKRELISDLIDKVKLHDAGEKIRNFPCESIKSSSDSDNISYPSLYLTGNQAPDLKNYEVGDEVVLVLRGKLTSHDLSENGENIRESFNIKIEKLACN